MLRWWQILVLLKTEEGFENICISPERLSNRLMLIMYRPTVAIGASEYKEAMNDSLNHLDVIG
jgi:hypothetical protein